MVDEEIVASQLKTDRFPFPSEGDITLTVRNVSFALGPVMPHIIMTPGSVIPAHDHESLAEALYVMEGEFINEGKRYQPGTSLHFKAGNVHGPHGTEKGCTILVLWTDSAATQDANLGDFVLAQPAPPVTCFRHSAGTLLQLPVISRSFHGGRTHVALVAFLT